MDKSNGGRSVAILKVVYPFLASAALALIFIFCTDAKTFRISVIPPSIEFTRPPLNEKPPERGLICGQEFTWEVRGIEPRNSKGPV